MKIEDLNGKNVCILGFGREGKAAVLAINTFCPDTTITVCDANPNTNIEDDSQFTIHNSQFGASYLQNLDQFDLIIKSPGIPPQPEFTAVQDTITNSTQIFLDTVQSAGSLVIGITGSKGKSTTASLIAHILKEAGKDVHLVGNIGKPTLDYLEYANSNTIFVQEMSSFQLENVTSSPQVAVVTSFFPDHLDHHGNMDVYRDAKAQIARFQSSDNVIYFNDAFEDAAWIADQSAGQKISFNQADSPIEIEETRLIGTHNLSNIAAAAKVCSQLDVPEEVILSAIKTFEGLPHRLQSLGVHHGIEWIDDAISTTPESTIAAIHATGDRLKAIILGGKDRGYDFSELGKVIDDSSIEYIVFFPETGVQIQAAISREIKSAFAENMNDAVQNICTYFSSSEKEEINPISLLSTASPSHNMFRDFEEKGDQFKAAI